tara:strand:+ start:602 stop:2425 length:1824 start_codon:yes stop_codon:yes gene_type:complete
MNTRKRKFDSISSEKSFIDWNKMISASKVRNYLLKDPLLDWLNEFNISTINSIPNKRCKNNNIKLNGFDDFTTFIMNQGLMFESNVYRFLKRKYQVVQVAEAYQARNVDKFYETIECMKKGVEIIYQGVLHDYENNIYGCPDLLVRSDRINDIFKNNYLSKEEQLIKSPKLDSPFHYLVIDIKHSTLYLTADGIHLRNCNSIPCYKGQILMYTRALGNIQGYQSKYGFVLGKKTIHTKNNITTESNDFMNTLGVINYDNFDKKYNDLINDAITWIHKMRTNGHKWKLLPFPSVPELYPNMKNEKDGHWRSIKNDINNKIYEITNVWMCSVEKRKNAHKKKIYSWKNKRCNSKNLGFKPGKIYNTVDHILKINRQSRFNININSLNENDNWRYFGDDTMEFYLDFETINSNMGQCILSQENVNYNSNDIIFMIGLGWIINDNWNYKCFTIKKNNSSEELKIFQDMWDTVDKILVENNKSESLFFHWSQAEPSQYKKLLSRHNESNLKKMDFYDLYNLFTKNNIVVKGALNFSLKSIAKAMFNNKMINSCWNKESPCSNGLNAMLLAYKLYKHNNTVTCEEPIMKDIIYYNMIDCKVLWEILRYLRNNH